MPTRTGFDDCWLKVGVAPKISAAKVPKSRVHEALLRSLIADLRSICRRLAMMARRGRAADELAPPHVDHGDFLPSRFKRMATSRDRWQATEPCRAVFLTLSLAQGGR